MPYWVKRIIIASGEVVAEGELRDDENASEDIPPLMGEKISVTCRGRTFEAIVVKGPTKEQRDRGVPEGTWPLRVSELVYGVPSTAKWMQLGERTIRFR